MKAMRGREGGGEPVWGGDAETQTGGPARTGSGHSLRQKRSFTVSAGTPSPCELEHLLTRSLAFWVCRL